MKKYYSCVCRNEILVIERDEQDVEERQFNIAIYTLGKPESSWWNRLRYIWRIITTGSPYGDCMILENDDMERLANDILGELRRLTNKNETD